MLSIYRVDHLGQVTSDFDAQVELMRGLFGFELLHTWESAEDMCRGARLSVRSGHAWEVLAPTSDDSPLQAFMDDKGGRPGLHHVAVEVPDLEAARAELEERGIKPTDGPSGGWIEAPLSPPDKGNGVLFRLNGPGAHAMCGDDHRYGAPPRTSGAPALGIVGIDHVCQAWWERDELADWYRDLAGFVEVWRTPLEEHEDMADLVLNIPGSAICWEVIMPRGEESFIERFLDRSGPAAHHVTMEVADWEAAMSACAHHGIEPFDSNEGVTDEAAWRDTFLHPKATGGVLVQLFWEERPGVWVRSDKIPPRS